jgi:hypothetical protein
MPNVGMKVALYPGSDGNIEKAALFGMIALDWGTLGVSADDPFCVLDYQALKALVNNLPPPDPDAELVYSGGGSAYSLQTPSDKAGAIGGTVWNIVLAIVLATVIAVSVIAFVHIRKQKSPDKN